MQTLGFSPFPLLIGLSLLTGIGIRNRVRGRLYLLGLALFGLYLLALVAVVFFPIPLPLNWPANLTWHDTLQSLRSVNLILFNYGSLFHYPDSLRTVVIEIVRNIILTVPAGLGLSFLSRYSARPMRGRRLLLTALGTGLALEGLQLLLKLVTGFFIRSVDINDVLWNALGVLVGAGMYWIAGWLMKRTRVGTLVHFG